MGASESSTAQRLFVKSRTLLQEPRVLAEAPESFWNDIWTLPTSVDDVWAILQRGLLRQVLQVYPFNLALLLTKAVAQMDSLVFGTKIQPSPAFSGRAEQIAFNTQRDGAKLLNCLRVLTRILSVIQEDRSGGSFSTLFLWHGTLPQPKPSPSTQGEEVKQREHAKAGAALSVANHEPYLPLLHKLMTTMNEKGGSADRPTPLAKHIMLLLVRIAFLPGFTISEDVVVAGVDEFASTTDQVAGPVAGRMHPGRHSIARQYCRKELLWYPGVGGQDGASSLSPYVTSAASPFDAHRAEVLRALLVCFCGAVFAPQHEMIPGNDVWLDAFTAFDMPFAQTLCASLLNTVCTYDPSRLLPYAHTLFTDHREGLVVVAVQLLLVLVDYCPLPEVVQQHEQNPSPQKVNTSVVKVQFNRFAHFCFADLVSAEDLGFCYTGITRILNSVIDADNTYLPSSARKVACVNECMLLLWFFADNNAAFFDYVLDSATTDTLRMLRPMTYFLDDTKANAAKLDLMHCTTYLMLRFSSERDFSVKLGTTAYPHDMRMVGVPNFHGTYADLVILVAHRVILSSRQNLESALKVMLTVLSNISPYLTSLSPEASVKLVSLFELLSSPRFLLANTVNRTYVVYLLEVFQNIVQYQYAGNSCLIYGLIRKGRALRALDTMDRDMEARHGNDSRIDVSWLREWKRKLPLRTLIALLDFFDPLVEDLGRQAPLLDDKRVLKLIRDSTLVGVIPVPHPIFVRKLVANPQTRQWFSTCIWSLVVTRHQRWPLVDAKQVKLFLFTGQLTNKEIYDQARNEEKGKRSSSTVSSRNGADRDQGETENTVPGRSLP